MTAPRTARFVSVAAAAAPRRTPTTCRYILAPGGGSVASAGQRTVLVLPPGLAAQRTAAAMTRSR